MSSITIQKAIAQVTDPTNPNEDWTTIMYICDRIAAHTDKYVCIYFLCVQILKHLFQSAETAIVELEKSYERIQCSMDGDRLH